MKPKFESNLFLFLLHFILKQGWGFLLLGVACLANAFSVSIWPKITAQVIDSLNLFEGNKLLFFKDHHLLLFTAIGFWLVIELMTRMLGFTITYVMPRLEANLKSYLYSRVSNNTYEFYLNSPLGTISNKIGDLPRAANYALNIVFTVFVPFIVALLISSYFFGELNLQLMGILVGWLSTHIILSALFCKRSAHLSQSYARARSNTLGGIVDSLSNILSVKLFSNTEWEFQRIKQLQEEEVRKNRKTLTFIECAKIVLGILGFASILFMFWKSITLWQQERISMGSVIMILTSTLNLWALVRTATEEMAYLFCELGVCKQSLELLEWDTDDPNPSAQDLVVTKGEIVFDHVTFNYKNSQSKRVFDNKSVVIHGGQKIGLVGFSGSGKTTFAKLLLKLFDIESGQILIDGQDISKVNLKSLRSQITFIPQEPYLFNRSVWENIAYNAPDASIEEVKAVARQAYCHEFIEALSDGYDTVVGERGSLLSGGQRQRLMIARAILKNTPIIIMDEATSALDSITEQRIQEGLKFISEGKTTLIIAHRLSTLMNVDRILVFHDGNIVEDGSHEELLKHDGHYKMLWNLQSDGFLTNSSLRI